MLYYAQKGQPADPLARAQESEHDCEMDRQDNKERIPYEHYRAAFSQTDPLEASLRCNADYDSESQMFRLRLMGTPLEVKWPEGFVRAEGEAFENSQAATLVLRYLCEGGYARPTGKTLDYRQIPWGDVYYRQFEGRCLKRLAFGFGGRLEAFRGAMEKLGAEKAGSGDASYRFAFLDSLYVTFILWEGDDEFPPSAQILFDDNIPAAFTAEDCAVVGDISISRIKQLSGEGRPS